MHVIFACFAVLLTALFVCAAGPADNAAFAEAEGNVICLTAEGKTYQTNVQVSVEAGLYAAECGGWQPCFERMQRSGATPRRILNWAAYPLGDGLTTWLAEMETPPLNATVTVGAHAPVVTPHKDGRTFDQGEVLQAVADCLVGNTPQPIRLHHAPAALTTNMLKDRTHLMASFATPYAEQPTRVHNLRLACRALNGLTLEAGETCSFNATVGARSAERGYKEAKIIVDGRFTEGLGGGVCQVSTTLYNAAMLAGLRQVEVHQHSLAVHYTQPGRDAMVSGWSDLKFCNDTPYPVYLFAEAKDGQVRVRVYGQKPSAKTHLRVHTRVTEPHRDVDEAGNVLPDTTGYTLLTAGTDGISTYLERTTGGRREVLRRNSYPKRDAVWQPSATEETTRNPSE